MNMRQWASNDKEVMNFINVEDWCDEQKIKVLGMIWNVISDQMCLTMYKPNNILPVVTKREIAKAIASVYDPLGIFCPVILQAKVLLQ